jgi:hypothetical protein
MGSRPGGVQFVPSGARRARRDRDRGRRRPLPLVAAWSFPPKITLGLPAGALTTEITVDYGELEDARWCERDWLLSHKDARCRGSIRPLAG